MNDLRNMLGRTGVHGGRTNAQSLCIRIILFDKTICELFDRDAFLIGTLDHLIINIRKILNKSDLIPFALQLSAKHIKGDKRSCVSDVKIIINSRTTGVDADFSFVDRFEFLFTPCHAVKNFHINCLLIYAHFSIALQAALYQICPPCATRACNRWTHFLPAALKKRQNTFTFSISMQFCMKKQGTGVDFYRSPALFFYFTQFCVAPCPYPFG